MKNKILAGLLAILVLGFLFQIYAESLKCSDGGADCEGRCETNEHEWCGFVSKCCGVCEDDEWVVAGCCTEYGWGVCSPPSPGK
jgi:hypothetical protein